MTITASLLGRLRKFDCPVSRPLIPIYEAISNSIDSFAQNNTSGNVSIKFERDRDKTLRLSNKRMPLPPFKSVVIIDDGEGFTDINFESFCRLDSELKANIGGKGVGRLTWLKVFHKASIESIFFKDGKSYKRIFEFCETENGIHNHECKECVNKSTYTKITLHNLRDKYVKHFPKELEKIAERIASHFLCYYIFDQAPKIIINEGGESYSISDVYRDLYGKNKESGKFIENDIEFYAEIVFVNTTVNDKDRVFFCASNRVVTDYSDSLFSNYTSGKIYLEDKPLHICTYVHSDYLTKHVNESRTEFNIARSGLLFGDDTVRLDVIKKKVGSVINSYLKPLAKNAIEEHTQRVNKIVNYEHPRYRGVVHKNPAIIDEIPLGAKEDDMIVELEKQYLQNIKRYRSEVKIYLEKKGKDSVHQRKERLKEILENSANIQRDKLADYIMERRAILDVADDCIGCDDNGILHKEEEIHEIIFPRYKTSDEIMFGDHNLWIIDERLSYHNYLMSDKSLKGNKVVATKSNGEPDIISFVGEDLNRSDPFNSVVIIEFKRPVKSGHHKCPIQQILDYTKAVRAGDVRDDRGKKPPVSDQTRYYAYIIADMDEQLEDRANEYSYEKTPDGQLWYGRHSKFNLNVEIIPYNKLIGDAQKRNRILFDKLGLL
ncbi:Histidine kinase-, DNA gyrase B-, and HSP90-like ATPase [Desulfomicrobium norvegicum]|uniref:Histidine kinase-, DNA gyrase B-, and HSP90-like ATPase n=1 Tax=Desulfomicrobium norvegicum (strain DSM 1741 / NCIMB 8310) TaxID=52561 RepID=A0A8G2F5E9_DESNO|nr:ATP-binding protein [Desulfomicrobium norvegicum]SFM00542.1 Histidine kinase-, DNA gyrase B-, and HSP90-like ATPase [Desulfomicrobium norvegicum]